MNQDVKDNPSESDFAAAPEEPSSSDSVQSGAGSVEITGLGDEETMPNPNLAQDGSGSAEGAMDPVVEIAALRATVDSHWDKLLRSNAELDNLRKRTQRDLENAHRYALERFVAELLPVKDSLELGLNAATQNDEDMAAVREGLELTLKMFSGALEKFAIEEINPLNEAFDPELHQAMTAQEDAEHESGSVINVVQKGYRLNQRLIRPALVIVAK